MRVMVLATHPEEAPSTRFRVDQYRRHLEAAGITLEYRFLFDGDDYRSLRAKGRPMAKVARLARALSQRRRLLRGPLTADLIWVEREVAPVFQLAFTALLDDTGLPVLYDFDDAVFLARPGGNRLIRAVSDPAEATAALCRHARVVLPGNEFLADFAHGARGEVREEGGIRVLPTVIDTDRFRPGPGPGGERPVVGWVGSHTTLPYLLERAGALRALGRRTEYTLRIVSNVEPPPIPGVEVEFQRWRPDLEVTVFHGLDLGVYPVRDDHWGRGKCGFKAIEYAACGLPVVASPVGVLRDIVIPEETGLWADSDGEWCDALGRLLEDPDARSRWGAQGRSLVEDRYSVRTWLPVLIEALYEAASRTAPRATPTPSRTSEACVASPVS